MKVRVRFNRNVMGRRAGEVDWVEATPMVETMVRVGMLRWLDAPLLGIAHEDDPGDEPDLSEEPADFEVDYDAPFEELYDDLEPDTEVELPSGETIRAEELLSRLELEDDGGVPWDDEDGYR